MNYYRDTWAEIDLDAISSNVKALKQHLPQETQIMAVVKANAYGHGAYEVAREALESGATWLGVALLDEAIQLREQGIKVPILVLGWTRPEDLDVASDYHVSLTVFQKEWLEEAKAHYTKKAPVFFHIKLDTGMGRIGIRTKEELKGFASELQAEPRFIAEGVYTHFATADEADLTYFQAQNDRFERFLTALTDMDIKPNLIHTANSATALRKETHLYNMVRFGISMYGLSPSLELKSSLPFELKEAFTLHSRFVHVKRISKGETVGYGATYQADHEVWVGTIPVGYADGWLRKLTGMDILVSGKRMPIIGRICMDQMMCELDQPFPVGEKVTLIGGGLSIDEIAQKLGTINYEIPCMINERVPRIYFKNGKKQSVRNALLQK